MESYPKAAMERAMKVQEVILRAMAKKITLVAGGGDSGASATGSMRRWRERYEKYGYDGLFDRRRGKPSREAGAGGAGGASAGAVPGASISI